MEEDFVYKLKQVKSDVETANSHLKSVLNILSDDLSINNAAFKKSNLDDAISDLKSVIGDLNSEISSLNINNQSSSNDFIFNQLYNKTGIRQNGEH